MTTPYLKAIVPFSTNLKCHVALSLASNSDSFTVTIALDSLRNGGSGFHNTISTISSTHIEKPKYEVKNEELSIDQKYRYKRVAANSTQRTESNQTNEELSMNQSLKEKRTLSPSKIKPLDGETNIVELMVEGMVPRRTLLENGLPSNSLTNSRKMHPLQTSLRKNHKIKLQKKYEEEALKNRINAFIESNTPSTSSSTSKQENSNQEINFIESRSSNSSSSPLPLDNSKTLDSLTETEAFSSKIYQNNQNKYNIVTITESNIPILNSQNNNLDSENSKSNSSRDFTTERARTIDTESFSFSSKNPISEFRNMIEYSLKDRKTTDMSNRIIFTCKITKEEHEKITWKYKSISFLRLYKIVWESIQSRSFEYKFTSSTFPHASELKHDDPNLSEKIKDLQNEVPQDSDLLLMCFKSKKGQHFTKNLYFIFNSEKQRSIQENLKSISLKFSTSFEKTMDLEDWKSYLSSSKTNRQKIILYATLLLGRVRDITPRMMRKSYDRFKILIHSLLNPSIDDGNTNQLSRRFDEFTYFRNFKKDKQIGLLILSWLLFEMDPNKYEETLGIIGEIFSLSSPTQQLSFIYLTKARMEYSNPDLQIVDYNRCIDLFPIFSVAYVNRADVYYKHFNNGEKAMEDLDQAIRLDPSWSIPYCNRGAVHKYLYQNLELAQSDYNIAISCDPNNETALFNRGLLYCALNRFHMALVDFNRALSLRSNNAITLYNRALVHMKLKNYDKAKNDFSSCLSIDQNIPEVYYHRARLHMEQGDIETSIEDLNNCIELKKSFAMAYFYRGQIRFDRGEMEDALSDLDAAVHFSVNSNLKIILTRATFHEYLGNFKLAIQDYYTCLLLNPNLTEALEKKNELEIKINNSSKQIKESYYNEEIYNRADRALNSSTHLKTLNSEKESFSKDHNLILSNPLNTNFNNIIEAHS